MSVYIDLSEFLMNPITTGIQRISGEICKWAPKGAFTPVRLHNRGFVALPPALIAAIVRLFAQPGPERVKEIQRLGAVERGVPVSTSASDTVLVPEVFDNPDRFKFFRSLDQAEFKRCRFIVYDLLPLTHPEFFHSGATLGLHPYYWLLRSATCCGFISDDTRDDYYRRLLRTSERGGVVLPLGSDALGPKPERMALDRPLTFTVLGTIEPRKNHEMILDAFEPLLRQVDGLRLSFIGKIGWVSNEFADRVTALAAEPNSGFSFYPVSGDDPIRKCIQESRATIYVSAAEGYGLPPVESLWLGTPVIASAMIPSLKRLDSKGIHFVDPLNVVNLRRAVIAFVENEYANRKTEEIKQLNLPTWQSFTEEVLHWCAEGRSAP
jgi:glycosyltransferase involved in cell wall biosynthesis